jgi:long-chain acyl-CoA synthetase
MPGGSAVTGQSEAINLADIAAGLPRLIHEVADRHIADSRSCCADQGRRSLDLSRTGPIGRGDRGQPLLTRCKAGRIDDHRQRNCIAPGWLLLAANRINAWAIVANLRLSPRELDQIRDHSGARLMFLSSRVFREATAHASRCRAESWRRGPFKQIGIGPLNESAVVMADAESLISDRLRDCSVTDSKVAVQVA